VLFSTLQTYVTQVQRLVHDASSAQFSPNEIIDYINTARDDVALDMHCVRTFFRGVQGVPNQEIYSLVGAVPGAQITAGGSYPPGPPVVPPTVVFDPPPAGGIQAQGTAVMLGNAVSAINLTQWGQGYLTAPNITFNPPGATATSVFFANVFQVNFVYNIWNNQRYMLDYRGFAMFGAYFRAWTTVFASRPGIWTIHPEMLEVYLRPPPDQNYFMEWDVLSLPLPLVNLTDVDTQVRPPHNKAIQFRASALALMKNNNFDQAEYYDKKYDERVPRWIMGNGGIRIPNPYNRNFQRRMARG
jgi:hypothetical protein